MLNNFPLDYGRDHFERVWGRQPHDEAELKHWASYYKTLIVEWYGEDDPSLLNDDGFVGRLQREISDFHCQFDCLPSGDDELARFEAEYDLDLSLPTHWTP